MHNRFDPSHIQTVMVQAQMAFAAYRRLDAESRAGFLEAIAAEMEAIGDLLIETAQAETNLPAARLLGERGRTCFQLRLFAQLIREGSWVDAAIDTAQPERAPLPKPDLRRMLIPLGPIVVFGASNFPLAYSTAGGDTASALAAGCPVIVKAHPAHPQTSLLVFEAMLRAAKNTDMPAHVVQHIAGDGFEWGKALVQHPITAGVGFTGSFSGGTALLNYAQTREKPIPVFAEMGSVNPVVFLPDTLGQNAEALARQYAGSITLGVGQFCTNPGLLLAIDGPELDSFLPLLSREIAATLPAPMLHTGIHQHYYSNREKALNQKGITVLSQSTQEAGPMEGAPLLASVEGDTFLNNPVLHQEVFGPYALLVKCKDKEQLKAVLRAVGGQLTTTLMASETDLSKHADILEEQTAIAGRIILNGVPTGVEVCAAMVHGGPFPATTDSRFTSVGPSAIRRWARPVSYQGFPQALLPDELKNDNPRGIWRMIDNNWTKLAIVGVWLLLLATPLALFAQQMNSPEQKTLQTVLASIQDINQQEFPPSDKSPEAFPLGRYREEDFMRRYNYNRQITKRLETIPIETLPFTDQVSLMLMLFVLKNERQQYEFKAYLNPILADDGFHISFVGNASQVITSEKAARSYLSRLKAFPEYAEEHLALMRRGLEMGICQPKTVLEGYESTYDLHIVDKPEQSRFFDPLRAQNPSGIAEADWEKLRDEARQHIRDYIVPTYKRIKTFFEEEYLPKTKAEIGVWRWPNGKAYYQTLSNYFTTTDLPVEDIHNIGLKEVARIEADMEAIIKEVGFKGSLQDFIAYLRTDPRFYATTPEDLLKEAAYISKKAEAQLPRFFGKLPRLPFGVAPVPDYLAPKYTGGRYVPADIHGREPGYYWVNTYNLSSRPLYVLEALTLHEAVPGHHLQGSLTQELDQMPEFRHNLYVNAFGEGWALYCEYLGTEMGFYKDPYSRFGRLTYEMWRACRLVIDTGIHYYGWNRQQAVDYLASHTALSIHEVNTEIDRYIAWPGQALSYKMGELKIRELRQRAEAQLGSKFDIRSFHDMLLSQGAVTLQILERMVDQFIKEKGM